MDLAEANSAKSMQTISPLRVSEEPKQLQLQLPGLFLSTSSGSIKMTLIGGKLRTTATADPYGTTKQKAHNSNSKAQRVGGEDKFAGASAYLSLRGGVI